LVTAIVYALHQDFWFWRSARPLIFGILPIGLFYHACYTLGCSALLWVIVRRHWPSHLEVGQSQFPHVDTPGSRDSRTSTTNVEP
jgi:hypothetical protein